MAEDEVAEADEGVAADAAARPLVPLVADADRPVVGTLWKYVDLDCITKGRARICRGVFCEKSTTASLKACCTCDSRCITSVQRLNIC